jgi:outer membrane protein assembly factor BamB
MSRRRAVGLFLAVLAGSAVAADWPRFRGPNGTGASDDADLPVQWSAGQGVLWKAALPGVGHSSPVVAGGKVYLQSASEDGRQRLLLCLDAGSGKELWRYQTPAQRGHTHTRNTLASSTPAVEGRRVFAVFWDGRGVRLAAFDTKGSCLWQRDLGPFRSQHGPGFSPVVVDGMVMVNNDQDGSAELLAFDAASGKPMWRSQRQAYRACYSTPFVRDLPGGGRELLVVSTAAISGYDPATGEEHWHCNWPPARMPLRTVSSAVLADGVIVATAGDGAGDRLCVAVKPGVTGDVTATNLLWEDRKAFPYVPSVLAHGKHVYSVNDAGFAACHVARTGEMVWQHRLGPGVTASPVLAGGKVFAVTEDGEVVVYRAAPRFELLGRSRLGEPVYASPAVADNRLYVRGTRHLFCIGKAAAGSAGQEGGAAGDRKQ